MNIKSALNTLLIGLAFACSGAFAAAPICNGTNSCTLPTEVQNTYICNGGMTCSPWSDYTWRDNGGALLTTKPSGVTDMASAAAQGYVRDGGGIMGPTPSATLDPANSWINPAFYTASGAGPSNDWNGVMANYNGSRAGAADRANATAQPSLLRGMGSAIAGLFAPIIPAVLAIGASIVALLVLLIGARIVLNMIRGKNPLATAVAVTKSSGAVKESWSYNEKTGAKNYSRITRDGK